MRNKGLRSFLRALLCLCLGLLFAFLAMTALAWADHPEEGIAKAAAAALEEGLLPMLSGGWREGPLPLLGKAAPAALLSLGVSLAWQAGMLQLGGAGHYALGTAAAMLCASALKLSWPAGLAAAALAGALWGALPGLLKAKFRLREGLGTALTAWIALYALQALPTLTPWEICRESGIFLPALLIAGGFAALLWLHIRLQVMGLEKRLLGASVKIARYAGADTEKTAFLVLCLSGLLGGAAGGMDYLLGGVNRLPDLSLALTGPGLYGLTAAALAGGHPLAAVGAAAVIRYLSLGAETMSGPLFTREMGEAVLAAILYCCACFSLRGGKGERKA